MEHQVTLTEMLDARERRAFRQQELLRKYHSAMICFTMNIAGPVKNDPLILRGFQLGKRLLEERMDAMKIKPVYFEESSEVTGNEAFYVLDRDPVAIKRITSDVEDGSDLGRLFDMDVLREDGQKVDRTELGLSPRRCLVCGGPAKECSRSRIHSVTELQSRTKQILTEAIEETDAKDAARLAVRALLYEVCTTPKPGLVDRSNSGSHKDMDVFTFMDSASALFPYFETCARIGKQTSGQPAAKTFLQIRPAGKRAEADMFSATRGSNTHKGAIFSMGILCAALGRLPREQWKIPELILKECAAMTQGLTDSDFAGLTKETAVTTGQKLYLQYQITGIRGQVEAGLPAVQKAGLPVLKEGLARGLTINDAGCAALLALMASATDTNLIARSDIATQQKTVEHIKAILAETPYPDKQVLEQLDREFIQKNLSPGGSADLLSICYFLYFLESEA
ncbi:MAG: triphosphoribosyl-dephospho-CoA synthase CitG [Eubacteriales bacterium]|nr:triphosphoribosyl-dephospho-CoA synthase CitG [Eubacteriales bacterium]